MMEIGCLTLKSGHPGEERQDQRHGGGQTGDALNQHRPLPSVDTKDGVAGSAFCSGVGCGQWVAVHSGAAICSIIDLSHWKK
jgi:hypothetical protein